MFGKRKDEIIVDSTVEESSPQRASREFREGMDRFNREDARRRMIQRDTFDEDWQEAMTKGNDVVDGLRKKWSGR